MVDSGRHRGHRTIGPLALPLLLAGCLPQLVGSARVLHQGEYTLALAATGRSGALPAGIGQAGPAAGVIEGRAGLPGGRVESGVTLLLPWHATWDVKYAVAEESALLPALAACGNLGLVQPSFGGNLLATKSFGPFAVTGMGGIGQTNERLWPGDAGPFSARAETFYKTVRSWGAGLEWQLSPVRALLLSLVTEDASDEREATRLDLKPLGAREGRTWYLSAGLRVHWSPGPRRTEPTLTALRGTVLAAPSEGRFLVGQPGIYQATVLMDVHTQVTFTGAPAPLGDLTLGRAVLIQGIPLPQPRAFLARTIELQ